MAQAKGSRIGEAYCRGGGELVFLFHPRYLTFYSPLPVLYLAQTVRTTGTSSWV